jgi:excisionase family DNA binding protein
MADTAVVPGDALYSPQQLADYLGVPLATVYRWRYEGTGPRGIKVGKHVRYRRRAWRRGSTGGPTRTSKGGSLAWPGFASAARLAPSRAKRAGVI